MRTDMVPLSAAIHVRWDQMSALDDLFDARAVPANCYRLGKLVLSLPKRFCCRYLQLSETERLEILVAYLEKTPLKEICTRWKVSTGTIYRIKYAHIRPHELYLAYDEAKRHTVLQRALKQLLDGGK